MKKQHDYPHYFNRELSWLSFNERVLHQALDQNVPLLERLRFLTITASNLDEFFMVRVGGLISLVQQKTGTPDPAGLSPRQQLQQVSRIAAAIVAKQYECLTFELFPLLAKHGIREVLPEEIPGETIRDIFDTRIAPIVTPMAVDTSRFPLLRNLSLYAAVRIKPQQGQKRPRFVLIPLSMGIERIISVSHDNGFQFITAEAVLKQYVHEFFAGEEVLECVIFRITRNADYRVREDDAPDLRQKMEQVLDQRRQSGCIRLEIQQEASAATVTFLQRGLKIHENDIYRVAGPIDIAGFKKLCDVEGFEELRYKPWMPIVSPDIDLSSSMFGTITRSDILLSHPYDSFDPVIKLIEEAAIDPSVLAIKQILYRTSKNSPVVAALRRAAENGKSVTALIELKARFDEDRNIEWAKDMEKSGVQVIFGVKNLKTHAKLCLIVRSESGKIIRYCHFGTGNYNEITAKIYSDISYMTRNEELCTQASAFFNAISGYSQMPVMSELACSPYGIRDRLIEFIESEAKRKRHGQKAVIMAKMNSLTDITLIKALYDASNAGVTILLNVRGVCRLVPGVKKQSENIRVVSIVDRYLEHSRIFYFHAGGAQKVFISSADWMLRNLDRRIELMTPVLDALCRQRLIVLLETCFADTANAWELHPSGTYLRIKPNAHRKPLLRMQEYLHALAQAHKQKGLKARRISFVPHTPHSHKSEDKIS